tara:strand:+ start:1402 stop:2031 length:630 start_codon:yes stop_codon:yes gene_type:complete
MKNTNKIPLFIHINSCGGRYIRDKFCEKYNNNFIVHHINPRLWRDIVPRDKIVRIWKYRDPGLNYNTDIEKYYNISIFDINNSIPFVILRNPIERYKSENRNIENCFNDQRSYNVICKSLYVALTGNYNEYFLEFSHVKYNTLLNLLKDIIVIPINKIELLANWFEFNTKPTYKENKNNYDTNNDNIIIQNNSFDCKLYNNFVENIFNI